MESIYRWSLFTGGLLQVFFLIRAVRSFSQFIVNAFACGEKGTGQSELLFTVSVKDVQTFQASALLFLLCKTSSEIHLNKKMIRDFIARKSLY